MDHIIEKLNEIELASSEIMKTAAQQKKDLIRRCETELTEWDAALSRETDEKISAMQRTAEEKMRQQLSAEQRAAEDELAAIRRSYEENHTLYADQLFERMIRE